MHNVFWLHCSFLIMQFRGIWSVFTYFNSIVGPTTFMVEPSLDNTLIKRINSLLDIHTEHSRFDHNFQNINTINGVFSIDSPSSRGGSIDCMLSICLNQLPEDRNELDDILDRYISKFQHLPQFDLLLSGTLKEEGISESVQTNAIKIFKEFHQDIKKNVKMYTQILPIIIPGFLKIDDSVSDDDWERWIALDDEPELFQDILYFVLQQDFEPAFTLWKSAELQPITESQDKIKFYLLGSFIARHQHDFLLAQKLGEKALERAQTLTSTDLFTDAILNLVDCTAHIGMIMVFETAFNIYDAKCGLSDITLQHYERFTALLQKAQERLETCKQDPSNSLRQVLISEVFAKLEILYYKKEAKRVKIEEVKERLTNNFQILISFPFILNIIENRMGFSLLHEQLHEYEQATSYSTEALSFVKKLPKKAKASFTAWILQRQGWKYFHEGLLTESLGKYQQSLFEIKNIEPSSFKEIVIAKTEMRIGYILSFQKADSDVIHVHYDKARQIFEKFHEKTELSRLYFILGDLFKKKGNLSEALDYYDKCESLAKEIHDDESLGISLARKAKIAVEILDLNLALYLYQKALPYFEKINHPQFLGITYGEIGGIFQAMDQNEEAIQYYQRGLTAFRKEGNDLETYWILYKLVLLYLELNTSLAQLYAEKIFDLRKKAMGDVVNQAGQIVESLLLSLSSNSRDRLKAIFLLEQIVDEDVIQNQLTHAALIHLCEFLFKEIIQTSDIGLISDLRNYLQRLIAISHEFHVTFELIELSMLYAKLSLIELKIEDAIVLFKDAMNIAQHLNNSELKSKIGKDLAICQDLQKEPVLNMFKAFTLKERIEYIHLHIEIRDFIRKFII